MRQLKGFFIIIIIIITANKPITVQVTPAVLRTFSAVLVKKFWTEIEKINLNKCSFQHKEMFSFDFTDQANIHSGD